MLVISDETLIYVPIHSTNWFSWTFIQISCREAEVHSSLFIFFQQIKSSYSRDSNWSLPITSPHSQPSHYFWLICCFIEHCSTTYGLYGQIICMHALLMVCKLKTFIIYLFQILFNFMRIIIFFQIFFSEAFDLLCPLIKCL